MLLEQRYVIGHRCSLYKHRRAENRTKTHLPDGLILGLAAPDPAFAG
jgi:hypothetical protein